MTALDLLRRGIVDVEPTLFGTAIVRVEAISRTESNELLETWQHPLGACNRPFGQDHWLLICAGRPTALTVSASTVSPTIRDAHDQTWQRNRILELARIARHPDEPWSTRVMLRLWREVLADEWTHWPVELLASYQLPGTRGDVYRFDGWTRVRETRPARPGRNSTWAKPSKADAVDDGRKTLWVWHREKPL